MVRFGIVGTSSIAAKMADALTLCPLTEATAVCSRDADRGAKFAAENGLKGYCTSLAELCGKADAVYIASPNSCHREQSLYFLERGIPVLCEKPLASNLREVDRMLNCSERTGVLLVEAYKSRYMPAYRLLKELCERVAPVRNVKLSFCQYSSRYDAHKAGLPVNTFRAEYSNGALMDLGVYCLYPALDLFGKPDSFVTAGFSVPGGVDGAGGLLLSYPGMLIGLNYSKVSGGSSECEIQGENGTVLIDKISSPRKITLTLRTGDVSEYAPQTAENDMVYECEVFARMLSDGTRESSERVRNAFAIMDEARRRLGIRYPADTAAF